MSRWSWSLFRRSWRRWSWYRVLAAGAVTTSAGLVSVLMSVLGSTAFAVVLGSVALSVALGSAGVDAVASTLKSLAVGGGTFAGSGRGTAASIASSAALVRGVSDTPASAEVADTVRKVAATAISTRSNPARLVEQSRIVTPPWAKLPRHGTASTIVHHSLRRLDLKSVRLHAVIQTQTIHVPRTCSQRHAGQLTTN